MAPSGPYAAFLLGAARPLGPLSSSFQAQPAYLRAERLLYGVPRTPDPPGSKFQKSAQKHVQRFADLLSS